MRNQLIALLCASAISTVAFAADPNPSRVFDPPAPLPDERLHVIHDVDHPVMFDPHYADKAQWAQRAHDLREQVLVAEGMWPEPEHTPLNAVIHGKVERDGYTVEKVFFASMPGHYVSGSLYRPTGKTGKLPAVLCPHGHWGSGPTGGRMYDAGEKAAEKAIKSGAEKTIEGGRYPIQARCAMLARMGCIVFNYDMVGYADSESIAHRTGFTDIESVLRLQSFMGLQTWNSRRVLDFLCSLPDVDTSRLACTGASGGGTQTILLSVIDDRLAVSVPAVMVSEAMQGGCICENAPLLRVGTNNAELISCFAPKPLAMTSANDWTAEIETLGYPEIRDIYKLYGAADDVAAWHRSFPHNYNQVSRELMYNWMNKYLKLGQAEPVTEKPFVPCTAAELSVYDADHPRPADSLDAAALRKKMTTASDAQLAGLAKTPEEYRKVVGVALRVMVGEKLPAPADVLVGDSRGPKTLGDGFAMEKGTIRRKNATWETPYVAIVPTNWDGTVLAWIHSDGKASLFDDQGKPQPLIRKILDAKAAVIAPDLFRTGESSAPGGRPSAETTKYENQTPYGGFYYGYNRGILACRTSDVLSTIALARGWEGTRSIRLAGFGDAGLPTLLAEALSGTAVERCGVDLNHFTFAGVRDVMGTEMLPGALKYGDVWGLIPLCAAGNTELWSSPAGAADLARHTPGLIIHEENAQPAQVVKSAMGK